MVPTPRAHALAALTRRPFVTLRATLARCRVLHLLPIVGALLFGALHPGAARLAERLAYLHRRSRTGMVLLRKTGAGLREKRGVSGVVRHGSGRAAHGSLAIYRALHAC